MGEYPVAALYIDPRGPYPALLGPEMCWDEARDARTYEGPWPVVAHPPCERWGRYWGGGPSAKTPRKLGDDGGTFASALSKVRRFGGVLEHPEASHAFAHFGLGIPRWRAGWESSDDGVGRISCVAQGHYGHRARKLTWLYYVGQLSPADLDWSIPRPRSRLDYGFHSAAERRARKATIAPRVNASRLTAKENLCTPERFAHVLINLALLASGERSTRVAPGAMSKIAEHGSWLVRQVTYPQGRWQVVRWWEDDSLELHGEFASKADAELTAYRLNASGTASDE